MDDSSPAMNEMKVESFACDCIVCNLLLSGFDSYSFQEQKEIITQGRPTPSLIHLKKISRCYTRHFQTDVYNKCEWLCGCDVKCLLYCWPCLAFNDEKGWWNKTGLSDLNNLHKCIKRHSLSHSHLKAIIAVKTFDKVEVDRKLVLCDPLLKSNNEMHNEQVSKNREVLKRFIDTVCFLSVHQLNCLWFNSESETPLNRNTFLNFINLLAKYDETLKYHVENSTVFKETSNLIPNDLIASIGEVMLKAIKNEIESSLFVSITVDGTTDVGNMNQLSKVIRYVTKDGTIKERFLGFHDISLDRTPSAIYDVVHFIVTDLNCASKFVAQSYDGGAVNTGELIKLLVKVNETYPCAFFIHRIAHSFSLILQQSVCDICQGNVFFSTLNGMASFFSKSSKRKIALDQEVHKRLPKAAPIQWNYNGKLVQTVLEYRQPLIDFFEAVIQQQAKWDHETVICSRGYLDLLNSDLHFNLLLVIFAEILPFADELSSVLQDTSKDIHFCLQKINEFRTIVLSKKTQFEHIWNKLQHLDNENQSQTAIKKMRIDNKSCYMKIFIEIIENISIQIDQRFKNFGDIIFTELINFKDNTCISEYAFNSLKTNFAYMFDFVALRAQLAVIYSISDILNKNSVNELRSSLKAFGLQQSFTEVIKLCELYLAVPSRNDPTDSVFRRISNYIQSTSGQDRLSYLALIAIEKQLLEELSTSQSFYHDVIEEFAKRSGRIDLNYK